MLTLRTRHHCLQKHQFYVSHHPYHCKQCQHIYFVHFWSKSANESWAFMCHMNLWWLWSTCQFWQHYNQKNIIYFGKYVLDGYFVDINLIGYLDKLVLLVILFTKWTALRKWLCWQRITINFVCFAIVVYKVYFVFKGCFVYKDIKVDKTVLFHL